MKKQSTFILAYIFIWVATIALFWCFLDGADAMGFALLFLYILIPVTTFVVSLLIGKNDYWGQAKWFAPLVFGVMHMLTEYATFSMKNMVAISFTRINVPHFELILVGAAISAIGLGVGKLTHHIKSKHFQFDKGV